MDILLLILYVILLVFCAVLLISSVKKYSRAKWIVLFISEAAFSIGAAYAATVFDSLPGYGMMPGLTYFAEVLYSIAAACAFAAEFTVSAIIYIILKIRNKTRSNQEEL